MNLELPYMRSYLIGCLDSLRDRDMQIKEWVDPNYHHAFWGNVVRCTDPIDYFDSVVDGTEPENFQEGYILYNSDETEAIMKVVWAFDKVIKKNGIEQPDTTYINSPLWNNVISSSQAAYDLLVSNNKKYDLDLRHSWEKEGEDDTRDNGTSQD